MTTPEAMDEVRANSESQSHAFQADVSRLLHLMVHSIYSDRDIFLRELISNASDACEKLRYEALSDPSLLGEAAPFGINIRIRKEDGILEVADNGIGMSRDEMVSALCTIANSGTRAFLEGKAAGQPPKEGESEADGGKADSASQLIGQFGIGFYSAFMVADRVVVQSRRAGSQEAWSWSSDGKGAYETQKIDLADAPSRGTRVILHLNSQSKEFLEPWKLQTIVREHSGAISIPVRLQEKDDAESRQIADGAALWKKSRSEISEKEYAEFYHGLSNQFDDPALTIHWRVEGRHEYTVLAFVPGSRPFDLFDPERKSRNKLYVRQVLITQDAKLAPGWLRFVRLVVDSNDLPLNVSREMIQQSPIFDAIKRGVANRLVQELTKTAENNPELFDKIWENFGAVIKEGLYEDFQRRDAILKIARFATSKQPSAKVTLADYVANLRPNQTEIFYLNGDDAKRIAASPQLEGFSARGIEVLLLSDPVDAFWVSNNDGFDGKPFKSITQGNVDLQAIPLLDESKRPDTASADKPDLAALLAFIKSTLGEAVSDVRASDRLSESPVCLIAGDAGPDRQLERMLADSGRLPAADKPVLEINPDHALINVLKAGSAKDADVSQMEDAAWLLFDEARILDGDPPLDAAAFAARLTRMILKASH